MIKTNNPHKRRGEVLPYLSFAFLLLFCQQLLASTLQNGTALTNLASSSANLNYTLQVPSGATDLSFVMSGGSGDADLYVRFGSAPTSSSYDCRPYQNGNNETCSIANVQAGTYYVMLSPYTAFSGVSLLASFTDSGSGGGDPGGGDGGDSGSSLNESNLSGAQGSTKYFSLDVPAGASNLAFNMSGGSGDADLYVRFGAQPTTSAYDCRPYQSGNNESCPITNVQAGTYYVMLRGYSAYSGVSLSGTYDAGTGPGNTPPQAVIANGPFSALVGETIVFSSVGSNDPDGSITAYQWNFGNGQTSTQASPGRSYASAGNYTVTLTVTDNDGATASATSTVTITNPASGFNVTSHYYDKGSFDHNYTNYEAAFSDNYTDADVEIHSYIVVNFSANVSAASINASAVQVKRLDMPDNAENNQNLIVGTFELIAPRKAIFKPQVINYANPGGTFDWNNPNWNGLKPNYRYSVNLSSSIKDTSGNNLNTNSNEASWVFTTTDNDYGLYWYKDAVHAVKYVPGRPVPLEYYNPNKPTHIFAHGHSKTSVNFQSGRLRDYRREPMFFSPGSMYPSQQQVDLVRIWKEPARNHEGKAWNVGLVYWNQFADDDYANLTKPQMAEAKIWSTNGKGGMRYAIRKWNGSSWSTGNTNVSTNAPMKPVSVILADAFIAATQNANNPELRLSGESLGNQVVTAMSYILKKEYAEGRIGPNQFPKRLALLDPYWRNGRLENSWTTNHPAFVDLGVQSDSAASMSKKIIENVINFADQDSSVSFVVAHYDTSRATDGSTFGQVYGDANRAQRDITAITYLQASWITGNESNTTYMAHRHVFSKYYYFWTYAFAPPQRGFSASSSDAAIRNNMNIYKSTKTRYSISAGGNTPIPSDDNYSFISGSSWQQ